MNGSVTASSNTKCAMQDCIMHSKLIVDFGVSLDKLYVISWTIFPADQLTGAKTRFKPN